MKKNLNKILLEAVHRGIKLALDDFDDELIGQQTEVIKDKNITKNHLYFLDNFVDLGLPSGTIWAKYNLGCNYDLLINNPDEAKPKDWYGDYYSFGELEPKTTKYKLKEYVQRNFGMAEHFTKYNGDDCITKLELCDDPAYNNNPYKEKLNIDICVPSYKQFEELIENTTKSFFYNNGIFTCVLTSKINKEQIIFPLCGYMRSANSETIEKVNPENGYYMSSIIPQHFDWLCYALQIESNKLVIDTISRDHGMNVRPVLMKLKEFK